MGKINDFFKKNITWFHVVGMIAGIVLSLLYWYKSGQFSENILKKSPVLMSLWGVLTGYILIDLVLSGSKRKDDKR